MKKLILFISSVLIITSAFSQSETPKFNLHPKTGEIYYSEVIKAEGKSKDNLFLSAKTWFVDTFRSSKDVIQLIDKEEGVIIGKGRLNLKKGFVKFSLKLSTKEERYQYKIYNVGYEAYFGGDFDLRQERPKGINNRMWPNTWKKDRKSAQSGLQDLTISIIKNISSNEIDLKKDDW